MLISIISHLERNHSQRRFRLANHNCSDLSVLTSLMTRSFRHYNHIVSSCMYRCFFRYFTSLLISIRNCCRLCTSIHSRYRDLRLMCISIIDNIHIFYDDTRCNIANLQGISLLKALIIRCVYDHNNGVASNLNRLLHNVSICILVGHLVRKVLTKNTLCRNRCLMCISIVIHNQIRCFNAGCR